MWIQVRSMDGRKSARVDELSKLTKIEDLRKKIEDKFDAPPERQRLFYRGKQLEDGHTLFDYDVGLNDIIQILVRPILNEQPISSLPKTLKEEVEGISSSDESTGSNKENKLDTEHQESSVATRSANRLEPSLSKHFQVGCLVDAKDINLGAWFEAKILNICKADNVCEVETDNNDEKVSNSNKKLVERTDNETECVNNLSVKEKGSNLEQNGSSEHNSGLNAVYQRKTLSSLGIEDQNSSDGLVYEVMFEDYEEEEPFKLKLSEIRPRARTIMKFDNIKVGETYMVNYNIEDPDERGYWYDCLISKKKNTRTVKEIYGTIYMGSDLAPLDNCKILFTDEVFKIEETKEIELNSERSDTSASLESPAKRQVKPDCSHCKDIASRKCRFCNCHICGGKDEPGKQIMCDECDMSYHIWCLTPPLPDIPDIEEWYCPECKNDETEVVRAGEKLKKSKKKAKMASASSASNRDWGKGMACVGRTKECTLVPPNHFGSIPGIEVGMMWKFRVQGSEAGVHRPHVAGIHGRENEGSYSIVLAGGYEDDADNGEEFFYTGSGGRDLSGNKRTAEQSCDQTLTRMNKALALNCAAPLNAKTGAEAKNWKEGKPVRVVRSSKGKKHSEYCPEDGIRYDGLYKV
ncbi:E3 ubiquitin-protein ligase UHRF1-like, partial [Limulus polyphemus]|uniref:RING-type E3 ubiquitin transferase n=1 Tax=Limulus polyphemus TaxID=6850 RepID=A0ABM1BW83_LIMPO